MRRHDGDGDDSLSSFRIPAMVAWSLTLCSSQICSLAIFPSPYAKTMMCANPEEV
jgi:hypothetical protein